MRPKQLIKAGDAITESGKRQQQRDFMGFHGMKQRTAGPFPHCPVASQQGQHPDIILPHLPHQLLRRVLTVTETGMYMKILDGFFPHGRNLVW